MKYPLKKKQGVNSKPKTLYLSDSKPLQDMSYKELKRHGVKLPANGDIDKDGVINKKDCKPLDSKRHSKYFRETYLPSKGIFVTGKDRKVLGETIRKNPEMIENINVEGVTRNPKVVNVISHDVTKPLWHGTSAGWEESDTRMGQTGDIIYRKENISGIQTAISPKTYKLTEEDGKKYVPFAPLPEVLGHELKHVEQKQRRFRGHPQSYYNKYTYETNPEEIEAFKAGEDIMAKRRRKYRLTDVEGEKKIASVEQRKSALETFKSPTFTQGKTKTPSWLVD